MADEATDVNIQPVESQETTPTDSSTVENKVPAPADPIMDALQEEEPKEKGPKKETESEEPLAPATEQNNDGEAEETNSEEQQRGKKDANTRIRDLANQNRELRSQIERLNAMVYQPQSVQDLIDQGETEAMAEAKALRQEIEVERFNREVTELNHSLESESQRALQEFPMFDPDSDQYKPEIAERARDLYMRASGIQQDQRTGLIVSANILPYEFYKTLAETYQSSSREGQLQGQKATEKMLASVEGQSSAAPREGKKDPIMEGLMSDD